MLTSSSGYSRTDPTEANAWPRMLGGTGEGSTVAVLDRVDRSLVGRDGVTDDEGDAREAEGKELFLLPFIDAVNFDERL